jgi:glucans biosynthesis protein C
MGTTTTAPERRLDLDWIRILAVLLLIPFHSARVFDIFEPFYVKNADLSVPLTFLIGFLVVWQMPVLFLVAGASTWYALRHRTSGQYVTERLKRLMVPFVFGTLVIVPPQMYLALLHRSETSTSYLEYYPRFFELRPFDIPDYTGVGFSWAHLWFILNLFVISLVAFPLLMWLRGEGGRAVVSRLGGFVDRGWGILLFALLLVLVGDLPDLDGKPIFMHLTLFVLGFVLASDDRFGLAMVRNRWPALILGTATMLLFLWVEGFGIELADDSIEDVAYYVARNSNVWFWLVAILGFGQKHLTADNRVLRYVRDAAYPFYLLHQTVIIVVAFFVVQWSADSLMKFSVITTCSLVVTIGLYDLLVRRMGATRFLFGMKPKARDTMPKVATL